MDLGIAGRTALVCAASNGWGRGCAQALAADRRAGIVWRRVPCLARSDACASPIPFEASTGGQRP